MTSVIGINIAGAEFGELGGPHGGWPKVFAPDGRELGGYIWPSAGVLQAYATDGVRLARVPFHWMRMQPVSMGPLDPAELGRLKQCLVDAHAAGIKIIPDCHAYGRRDGRIATPAELADLWGKLAAEIKNEPALEAYDIMNEPHDMGADSVWYNMAEAAIIAIRRHDTVRKIHVAGDYWSGAWHWSGHLLPLFKKYPNLVAHAHQYLDPNGSGTYGDGSYTAPSPDIGVERIRPFVEWCKANNVEGFIGEFGVPGHIDPRWHEAQKRMLDYMVANKIGGTIWAGGAWWWSGYLLRMGAPGEETHPNFAAIRPYLSPVEAPAPTPVPVPPTPTPPTPTPPAPIVIPDVLPKRLLLALAENAVTLLQGRTTRAQLLTMTTQLRDGLKN